MHHQGKPVQPSQSLETSPYRVARSGIKINAPKSTFCTVEMKYLEIILTRTDIKPQPKKVQVILAIIPPKQVKDLRRFLGMVQYY